MPLLHSRILGEGKPLLILHGFLGMSDNWKTLGNRYAEKSYQVHLVDQRNHGKSFHSDDFSYQILAKDIKDYMEHYNLSEAVVLGHSMGGKTAMELACTYPNLVKKLIVADIGPKYYPPHHQTIINSLNAIDLKTINSRGQVDKELSKNISEIGIRMFLLKNLYWIEKGKLGFRMNLPILTHKMVEIGKPLSATALFSNPTLFIKGGNSSYILTEDESGIKSHFPNSTIKTIDGTGHWLHAENPQDFFDISLKFIQE